MSLEWSLTVVLITGLAALYLWYLAAEATIFERPFAYPREHWGPLWNCPWCLSFWTVGLILLATDQYNPVAHAAAAAVAGYLGSKA